MNQTKHEFVKNVLAGIGACSIVIVVLALLIGGFKGIGEDQAGLTLLGTSGTTSKKGTSISVRTSESSSSGLNDPNKFCGFISSTVGAPNNFTSSTSAMDFDTSGNLYVADGKVIKVYNKDGTTKILTDGNNISTITDLVVYGNSIYLLDLQNKAGKHRIKKYTLSPFSFASEDDGNFTGVGPLDRPKTLAIDNAGKYLFVGDASNYVRKVDTAGLYTVAVKHLRQFDSWYQFASDIALDSQNNLFVIDGGNNYVKRYKSDLNALPAFGYPGSGEETLNGPIGIIVDKNDDVYVSESSGLIKKFSKNTKNEMKLVGTFGKLGAKEDEFTKPNRMIIDSDGNILIFDRNEGKNIFYIKKFTPPCAKITILKDAQPDGPEVFNFSADFYGTANPKFSISDTGQGGQSPVIYNTFKLNNNITESIAKDYNLLDVKCIDPNGVKLINYAKKSGQTAIITLDKLRDVVCTFTNSSKIQKPQGSGDLR